MKTVAVFTPNRKKFDVEECPTCGAVPEGIDVSYPEPTVFKDELMDYYLDAPTITLLPCEHTIEQYAVKLLDRDHYRIYLRERENVPSNAEDME